MRGLDSFEIEALVYVGIFVGVLIAYEGVRQLLTRTETSGAARSRRMKMIAGGATTEDVLRLLRPSVDRWVLARLPLIGDLPVVLRQAGLTLSPAVVLTGCLAAAIVFAVAGSTFIGALPAAAVALAVSFTVPIVAIRAMRNKRMEAMVSQLPDALDLMARGLRVGHPINATIASVANDMSDPIATEFGIVLDQVSYGDDLPDAFSEFADRIDQEDVRYLAISIAIQHGTGSDLARVLNTLSSVIRARMAMRRRIQAISAEGRLTSIFLSALPIFILVFTQMSSPSYYMGVIDDPLFKPFAIIIGTLIVVNYLVLRRLVDFRI
ncbi:type II secretion system F family protein [Albidovulum sediminicola]|uniref:Type II secretion system F family protein n=1 Tax=Albidovulum sediminicola TaxID=2984331 RepID=A0ABT2Z3E8_9RHOB|nr:type II secretion system F family protein [Defluviimonas sp. WL0075]MCV2865631.1 type II secretion system F family protein [Defluviimonas sp. WL0075]